MKGKTWCKTTLQAYGLQPRTLLRTDSITDIFEQIFKNYSQFLSYLSDNCEQLSFQVPSPLRINPQQYKEYGVVKCGNL